MPNIIIKSGKNNWSGKEFSTCAAKLYFNFDDAISALNSYHFWELNETATQYIPVDKTNKLEIIFLNDAKKERLLRAGTIRL